MGIFQSVSGTVVAELTTACIPESLAYIAQQAVLLSDVRILDELTVRFRVSRRNCHKLQSVARRRGDTLKIIRREGLYWSFKKVLHRPVLLVGTFILLWMTLLLPGRILFVEVDGNESVPSRLILEAAGIRFGTSAREVRSERVKNRLLSAVPELQWVGVNTRGCVATISVRERTAKPEDPEDNTVSSIAAVRDGIVLSATVTQGRGLCTPGQAVRAGDILISGYADCGLCITATRAEGEILAMTNRVLTVKTPAHWAVRVAPREETVKFSLIIGKKRINFDKGSGISDASCVKMYSKYVLTLPGGFSLPVTWITERIICRETVPMAIDEAEASQVLSAFAGRFLEHQMVAGCITHRLESVSGDNGCWCLSGVYTCSEMIGIRVQEQIGVVP